MSPSRRIGFCISLFTPIASGAERQAQRQARELVRRGHQVTVFTRALSGAPAREHIDGVDVRRCIRTLDCGPLFGATFLMSLGAQLRRHAAQLDILHCHQGLWEPAAAGAALGSGHPPVVVQPAAGGPFGEAQLLRQTRGRHWLQRWILRHPAFVAISAQIAEEWLELGVPTERMHRLASGVATDEFLPVERPAASDGAPVVVFTGRLHPQKNLPVLLEAWKQVLAAGFMAELHLVGEGPLRAELQQQAEQLGISPRVRFCGAVHDPRPVLAGADVFVLPSVAEGMSNSLLEAMAMGLPSVVSNIGGNTDLVEHEREGLQIRADDPSALAAALGRLLRDAGLRRQLGASAREKIEAHYALPRIVDRYEALYEALIAEQSRARAGAMRAQR